MADRRKEKRSKSTRVENSYLSATIKDKKERKEEEEKAAPIFFPKLLFSRRDFPTAVTESGLISSILISY